MCIAERQLILPTTKIQYLEAGAENSPLLIFLHGFPENSWSWEVYLTALSDKYHVIAPDLPGYNGSVGFKTESEYHAANVANVIAEFIKLVSKSKDVHLIGHDWGGVIAWPIAAFYAELLTTLTILNAAHPSTFTREMLNNPAQQKASDYITDLISGRGYTIVSYNQFTMLKSLYAKGYKHLSDNFQQRLLTQWQDELSMQQAFNYYKQMPILHTDRLPAPGSVKIPNIRINVPTLVCWGMRDTAFVPSVLNRMDEYIKDLIVHKFESDDHWLHHRQPDTIINLIKNFITNQ